MSPPPKLQRTGTSGGHAAPAGGEARQARSKPPGIPAAAPSSSVDIVTFVSIFLLEQPRRLPWPANPPRLASC
jgi:hypothetical protein